MAAMHAGREIGINELGVEVELIYQSLRKARFSRGNPLQLASHLLALSGLGPGEAALRVQRLATAMKKYGQRVWSSQYDEVALLVLGEGRPAEIATKTIRYRDRLRAARPRPSASMAFSLAAGIVLSEQASSGNLQSAANLQAVQALVEAQQAAMIACMTAATAASAAAASS